MCHTLLCCYNNNFPGFIDRHLLAALALRHTQLLFVMLLLLHCLFFSVCWQLNYQRHSFHFICFLQYISTTTARFCYFFASSSATFLQHPWLAFVFRFYVLVGFGLASYLRCAIASERLRCLRSLCALQRARLCSMRHGLFVAGRRQLLV